MTAMRKANSQRISPRMLVIGLALAAFAGVPAGSAAEQAPPLFEAGLAAGVGFLPDYPGSDQNHPRALVLPYLRYRGEIIRSDERGLLRGRLLRRTGIELDLSLSGSFPTRADENDARRGMPDLDWLGEIGPRLQIILARPSARSTIELELPLRAAFSTDFSGVDYRGLVAAPTIAYQAADPGGWPVRTKVGAGPVFATDALMDYFYAVAPRHAIEGRPAYDASAGYLGTLLTASVSHPLTERISLLGVARWAVLTGAANRDSPLFRRDHNVAVGFGVTVSLYRSARRAAAD